MIRRRCQASSVSVVTSAALSYDEVNAGQVQVPRLRRRWRACRCLAWPDGRIRLAADVCNWLRPDAVTSPFRGVQ